MRYPFYKVPNKIRVNQNGAFPKLLLNTALILLPKGCSINNNADIVLPEES